MIRRILLGIIYTTFLVACSDKGNLLFESVPPETSGIDFQNTLTENDDLNILDYLYFYNGGGVAIGDINNDGLPDIYFTGNQVKNKLYLNKGNLKFEDITEKAGIVGNSDWNTGTVMGDVNGDGLLDIYVCAVVGINGFDGHNELFINQGNNTFSEESEVYGLDYDNYSSNAAFLDYDLDGDLDIYLLNHAVHNETSFGKADIRNNRTYESGDKLLRNDGNSYTDVSAETGIYGGANSYGLGIAISDFNLDGFPDIYVGNDFHEDDYYYLNNGDGTFSESLKTYFGHTSRFSMGNDIADINHDGYPDIISLDMLPEDEKVLKASSGDESTAMLNMRVDQLGYYYQFTRNMLHINNAGQSFTETALLSGVAATDWSWSALFSDYDQDGEQDLFVANGIPKRPNDLDYVNFTSSEQIRNKLNNTKLVDQQALDLMPSGYVHNTIFKGTKRLAFSDMTANWIAKDTLISNGAAYADLDNDGDLDIVTNNLNALPTIYKNTTNTSNNYLKLKLKYIDKNLFAIGTKVTIYNNKEIQFKELYTVRGFQSSSEPMIHFGLEKNKTIDSIRITWPNQKILILRETNVNQTLNIAYEESTVHVPNRTNDKNVPLFKKVKANMGINFKHEENQFTDFDLQKLIPYKISDRGPATAIGDLNQDGKDDIYFGGSSRKAPQIFYQTDSTFVKKDSSFLYSEVIYEDVKSAVFDFNKDGKKELLVVTGGGQFRGKSKAVQDRIYSQDKKDWARKEFPEYFSNGSALALGDYDSDTFTDVFIGNGSTPNDFGSINPSYLLKNNQGVFNIQKIAALEKLGIVTDAIFTDFDSDGLQDLIVVGEWMMPTFLKNMDGDFKDVTKSVSDEKLNGLWQSIAPFDIDGDGDLDYLLGNWGLNSKFKATREYPLRMYYGDFDDNSQTETIVAVEKNKKYYPLASLDELAGQLISLTKKKFPTYKSFAGKSIYEIYDEKILKKGTIFQVHELASGYLKNENGNFTFYHFSNELQVAPLHTFLCADYDGDGKEEALAAGNYFGVTPYHGRFDGFSGALIKDENTVFLGHHIGLNFTQKSVRALNIITIKNKKFLLATINDDDAELYEF